jgi:hypothetical protein
VSSSTINLWGQAWELEIKYVASNGDAQIYTITRDKWEPESLRMTFDVWQRTVRSPYWSADITIFNLNDDSIQNILFNATWATLKAGFQTGPNFYSIIWDGPVFQVLYDRDRVVDQRVVLRCIANPLLNAEIVSFGMGPYSSQLQFVNRMAKQVNLPQFTQSAGGNLGPKAEDALTSTQYPRGRGAFGSVAKYLQQIADEHFMNTFMDGSKAYISEMTKTDYTPDLIYSPPPVDGSPVPNGVTASIIGTPRQTPTGVIFTVLLDPRLKVQLPPLVVQLTQTVISQLPVFPNPNSGMFTPFSNNLSFLVGQVRHVGDTRGNDWQTEVTGWSTTYADSLLNGIFAAKSGG